MRSPWQKFCKKIPLRESGVPSASRFRQRSCARTTLGTAYEDPPRIRGPLGNTRRGVELIHLTAKLPPMSFGSVS
jgi:hypothetical protein